VFSVPSVVKFYNKMSTIAENLVSIRERIENAALRAGRDPHSVRLVVVCKTVGPERIREAIEGGAKILGENYVQEAQKKIEVLKAEIPWHFIGHLQKNKAKYAVRLFDMIHSVDSFALAEMLNGAAQKEGRVLPILLQVDLSREDTKFGAPEEEILRMAEQLGKLEAVSIKGLMTMPPYSDDPEYSRPYFKKLRIVQERVAQMRIPRVSMEELSMGMSGDFEVAVEEGATLVRIGTAIFGPRPMK
jgi:pyridoxal phosphate enzyme (YggS family)